MKRLFRKKGFMVMALVAMAAAMTIAAAHEDMSKKSQQQQMSQQQMGQQQQQQSMLCSVDNMMGADVKIKSDKQQSQMSQQQRDQMQQRQQQQREIQKDQQQTRQQEDSWYDVTDDQQSGIQVEDLAFDNKQDKVKYVVLTMNDNLHAVPFDGFEFKKQSQQQGRQFQQRQQRDRQQMAQMNENPDIMLKKITKDQLSQAPKLSSVDQLKDSQTCQQIDNYYSKLGVKTAQQQQGQMSRQSAQQRQQQQTAQQQQQRDRQTAMDQSDDKMDKQQQQQESDLVIASNIVGYDIQSQQEADLGNIEDIVFETQQGKIAYGLVSFGGILNIGEKLAAVPWSSIDLNMDQEFASLDATEDKLDAAVIEDEDNKIAKLSQRDFAQQVHENFGAEPYWTGIYGFVPGEEQQKYDANDMGQKKRSEHEDKYKDKMKDKDCPTDQNNMRY